MMSSELFGDKVIGKAGEKVVTTPHGIGGLFFGGFTVFGILISLVWMVIGVYVVILVIKALRRAIEALDLYIYSKNREIRKTHESSNIDLNK
ncbi:hypothetical protein KIH86_22480 [Paenibacillus sp. HN-1]|uniref:hypothetical protein n=1 Tax=Paenibacillus TaxID=44249 RepID=UPI001CA87F2D|nr:MULTISPECIES: hypothetical protein [Paenibacillus]MBY9079236.1 hypothetical protein [Paenibacillus sp. CGMCC 1.18879]MBY9086959.1 hypothetical protein [Paenibacillus sinensis]